MKKSYHKKATACAQTLVTAGLSADAYQAAAHDLLAILKELVPLLPYEKDHPLWTNVHIPAGLVVAPGYAQESLAAGVYIAQLASILHKQIAAHQAQDPTRALQVLYPACGPFFGAGLVVALLWPASALQLTLVEVSSAALQMAQSVAQALEIENRIAQFVHADASRWTPSHAYDLLLVSCLQAGLSREPQIAVSANLVPFLKPEGVLIPERIEVRLGALDTNAFQGPSPVFEPLEGSVQTLLCVDRASLLALGRPEQWQASVIPLDDIAREEPWPAGSMPAVFLEVELAPGRPLLPGATGATIPMARPDLFALDRLSPGQRRCTCQYRLDYEPGIVMRPLV